MNQHTRAMRSNPNTATSFVGVMTVVLIVISFAASMIAVNYETAQVAFANQALGFSGVGIVMAVTYVGMLVVQRFRR